MTKEIRTAYSEAEDTTFIMEDTFEDIFLQSTECIGWYCGEPNDKDTAEYSNRQMKATFEKPNKYIQQLKEFSRWFDSLPAIDPSDPIKGYIYNTMITIVLDGKSVELHFGATPHNAISELLLQELEEQS